MVDNVVDGGGELNENKKGKNKTNTTICVKYQRNNHKTFGTEK
jgi:hypothetical protein